jgi:uncharacterized protein YqgQ
VGQLTKEGRLTEMPTATKAKLKEFNVGVVYSVWADITVKAETFEQAYAKAKLLKSHEVFNLLQKSENGINDSHWDVTQVYVPDILDKHGF